MPRRLVSVKVDALGAETGDAQEAEAPTVAAAPKTTSGTELPFKVGEEVMAVWAGGTQWYKARILKNVGEYEVEFDDKTRHVLDMNSVTAITTSSAANKNKNAATTPKRAGSPSRRSKASSPGRSRSRKSPSRVRTPSKSPSRKIKGQETPTRKRSRSASRKAPPDEGEAGATSSRGRVKKSIAVSPSLSGDTSEQVTSRPAASYLPSSSDNSREDGLRQRDFVKSRMSAKVAAVQTARVAGVVTPGLISEGIDDKFTATVAPAKALRHSSYHFCGPFGAFVLTFFLPLLLLATFTICNKEHCAAIKFTVPDRVGDYLDLQATLIFFGWMTLQGVLFLLPVGRHVAGQPLRDGTRLKYRMNGPLAFVLSLGLVCGALYYDDSIADVVLDNLFPMVVTALLFSYALTLFLYMRSRRIPPYELSPQVALHTPNFMYDYFMGRELNPRPLGFELKAFLEFRPGLIGWAAINVTLLWKDYVTHGGQISPALLVSLGFQILYIFDTIWFEEAMLSTFDTTTEGLGFMLVFGDLVFVPTIFTLTSRFLVIERSIVPVLPWYCIATICAMGMLGYIIYRAANMQKDAFRCNPFDPSVSHLETINTSYVKKILVGGWWGWIRHPNYFGDAIVALAICLPSGFVSVIPYTYCVYLFLMLVYRAQRDDDLCRQKYGAAWDEYTTRVKYRIFKYVY